MIKKIFLVSAILVFAFLAMRSFDQSQNHKLRMAEAAIAELYVDSVDENKLVEKAIIAMLESLDPHSQYSNAEETKEMNEPLTGNFSGIGITFNMNRDTLYVISTISGGPSDKVGILAGDRIIAVNDTAIAGVEMKNSQIMKKLRGPKNTKVDVKVLRYQNNRPDTIEFTITRDDIPIYSVDAAYMVDDETGYLRINKFGAETAAEVRSALKDLNGKGMKNLILDLVDNGGGFLNAAVDIASEFLAPNSMVVYTEGLGVPRQENYSRPDSKQPLFADGRLVVMANQYSASASEITAGAIQDWDRGLVVGRRTFGKGLVQRPIPLIDGSMIRLTVAHYFTPTGRNIQKPYELGKSDKYREDIADRLASGELMHEDSIHFNEDMKFETLKNKRPIYGGGGIYPDKFVALDTVKYTKYYRNLVAKGLLNRYAISYVDKNRQQIKYHYKTDDDFVNDFIVDEAMLQELFDLATQEGIDFDEEQAQLSEELFTMIIKALIGRDIYDSATYFKIYNRYDPIFNSAYELINSQEYDELLKGK